MKSKLLVIAGPTAVGKTSLSIQLAKELNGEIVSADSMQVYKGLDIGTAKPSVGERVGVLHHMLDVCHPRERYSVAQYVKAAEEVISDIISRGKLPIIVGGTGLYIDNLISSNRFSEIDIDLDIRKRLQLEADERGGEALLDELRKIDPEYASKLHSNDIKRIVHSLEIYYSTGKTHSCIIEESRKLPSKYSFLYAVLDCSSRDLLYNRINKRVDVMMEQGLLEEAKSVLEADWYKNSTASQAIGYKEFEGYFSGEKSLDNAIELLKQHSRNYAKRQLTWFRHNGYAKFYTINGNDSDRDDIKLRIKEDFLNI